MRKLEDKVLQALCNLEGNPDFRTVQEWFLQSAADQDKLLRSSESATIVYRAQGAVKELLEFCELTAEPRKLAGKLKMEQAGIHVIP